VASAQDSVRTLTFGLVNRRDLQVLTRTRLTEAKTLLVAGHPDGAYYLAGYAVECGLKACIAGKTQRHEFPDKKIVNASYTHNLRELVKVANLERERVEEAQRDPLFRDHWDLAQEWSEDSRYLRHGSETAQALVDAIGDRKHGVRVIAWIKRYW
jgi:HEPN domain-containing protein